MAHSDLDRPSSAAKPSVGRRALLKGVGTVGLGASIAGVGAVTGSAAARRGTVTSASGEITAPGVRRALAALPDIIARTKATSTVPGVAVAVVYDGVVRYLDGVGTRQVGKPGRVTADTVFQLASVSKPISSTVVAAALTKKLAEVDWDDTVRAYRPGFTLSDRWVGEHVTAADMFAHRSGLPDHAGNLLEDLGYTGDQIISRLRRYPLRPFRNNYEYTNYGFTAAAEAIAAAVGRPWPRLADQTLFAPLGMNSSSFSFADLRGRSNRAALHRKVNGRWIPDVTADNDRQAPAGGASSSVRDMAKWLTMLLANGKPVTDVEQLQRIWRPSNVLPTPAPIGGRAGFYGLGWNVNYEDTGELRLSHSGGFGRGASTVITVIPSKKLAMVVLTNSNPLGVPEAISAEFVDIIRYGKSTRDWLRFLGPLVADPITADQVKYSEPATHPAPARRLDAYVGGYTNRLYGDLTVSKRHGALLVTVGPGRKQFPLRHHSGDDFYFRTTGEDKSGFSGAIFAGPPRRVSSLRINAWDADELGTFVRA
jgi:CubicO group peptidase (beta-lactamase class C family)